MSISAVDVDAVTLAAQALPPAKGNYLEPDFVMNVLATVIDYQTHTTTVERALEHFRRERWDEIRTFDDLEHCCKRFPDDEDGNTALAQYLWGYNMWTRAEQLRGLIAYFWRHSITTQEALRDWAQHSTFKTDFEGSSLGPSDTEPFGPWWNVAVVPPASATRRARRAVPTTGVSARRTPVQQNASTVSAFAS